MKIVNGISSNIIKSKNNNFHFTYDLLNKLYYGKPAKAMLGKLIVRGNNHVNPHKQNDMIIEYAKNGYVNDGLKMFKSFQFSDVYASNALLSGYLKRNDSTGASVFFEKTMPDKGVEPTSLSFSIYVKCLFYDKQYDLAMRKVQDMISRGFKPDEFSLSIYYTNLCKSGRMIEAFGMFQGASLKSVRLYNVFVKETGLVGDFINMRAVICDMWKSGYLPDEFTYECVISSLFRFGNNPAALMVIKRVVGENLASPRFFNIALEWCLKRGLDREVRMLASDMESRSILIQQDLRRLFLASVDRA